MAPAYEFPAPVLSVAADVVRELKGDDALTGLWTLFTKCKASLKDGHRLENISWRLWHRELATATPRPGHNSESEHDKDGNRLLDEKAVLITEQGDNCSEMEHIPSTHVLLPPYSIPVSSLYLNPKSPTLATVGPISTRCNSSVGRIIIDMLPNPLPPTTPSHPRKEMLAETDSSPLSYFALPQSTAPAPAPDTHTLPIRCHLPTPAGSELYLMPPSTSPTQSSSASVPQVQVQVDPAPPSTPPSMLPQLVIVHPTPGPTPHPTPPASPILGFGTTSGNSRPLEASSTAETAAAPSPKFTLHAEESTTSSSSDSSSASGRTNASSSLATTSSSESRPPAVATAVQAKPAANSTNGASSSIIAAPPPPSGPSTSISATPRPARAPAPTPAPAVRKTHSSPTPRRLSPPPAADAESSRARPRAQPLRQTTSTSNVAGAGSNAKGKDQRNKSTSRSRSRGRGADIRAGLMMTTATATAAGKRGSSTVGGGQRVRAVGLRKGASGKGGTNGRAVAREKRPTFNIGSHSDDVGSKSAGSGSSFSGAPNGNGAQHVEERKKEKQSALVPPQRPASASRLMPPSLRPLPDPATVLPSKQQHPRRTIVLATSDSDDYETETDITESESEHGGGGAGARRVEVEEEGDTADWSSEDMSTDDNEFVRRGGAMQAEPGHDKKGYVHPQHRSNSSANFTATNNHVHANNTTHNRHRPTHHHLSRAQQSRRNHAANAQYVVEQAAIEAERIRDMFAKKPVPSSEDLVKQRTKSVGLLTQLMHPDPEIFPPTHPYRRGHSSGDVKGSRGLGALSGGLTMTRASEKEVGQRARLGQGQASTRKAEVQQPQRRASAGPAPGMRLSKSSAAIPVASQVQVGSVSSVKRERSQESAVVNGSCTSDSRSRSGTSGGYRPKGRPVDQEMEDTESEGESGDAANGILVSKSVAQEKLRALAARRGIAPNERKEEEDPVPDWVRVSEVGGKGQLTTSPTSYHHSNGDTSILRQQLLQQQQQPQQPQAPTPTPIPLGHPYNLPPAAPPSTPRTTRRLMLQTEMSESLRRNLLWERQVSKVNLAVRRSASGGGSGKNGGTLLGSGPMKPLTALPSMVQLTAKQSGSGSGSGSNTSPQERENERPGSSGGVIEEHEREEKKKRALARNRSWANEFHYTGW